VKHRTRPGQRYGWGAEIVCGRKFCTGCTRWRHVVDFQCRRRKPFELMPRCATCLRLANRKCMAKREVRERRREYQRIWTQTQRRKAGIPQRNWRPKSCKRGDQTAGWFSEQLPAQPLLDWLAQEARRRGIAQRTLLVEGGLDAEQHVRWEQRGHVTLGMADAFLLAITGNAMTFNLLYPPEGND